MVQVGRRHSSTHRCGSPAVHLPWGMRSDRPPTFRIVGRQRSALRAAGPTPTNDEPNGGTGVKITRRAGLVALLASGALMLAACGSDNNTTPTTTAAGGTTAASVSAAAESGTTFEGAGFTCADRRPAVLGLHRAGQGHGAVDLRLQRQVRRQPQRLRRRRLRQGHRGLHRQPGRLRRVGLGAERRPGRRRPRRTRCAGNAGARTCRWSPARSRWPTTSPASTA